MTEPGQPCVMISGNACARGGTSTTSAVGRTLATQRRCRGARPGWCSLPSGPGSEVLQGHSPPRIPGDTRGSGRRGGQS